MKKDKLIELFKDSFSALTTANKVHTSNEYVFETNRYDDEIFFNDETFFNDYFGDRILDAIRAVSYGEYKYTDEYVWFDGYGNLETGTYESELPLSDIDEMAEWFADGKHENLSYISGMEEFVSACEDSTDDEDEEDE